MKRVINILLIEDDDLDQMNVRRVLDKMAILHRLKIAKNGEEALDWLLHNEQGAIEVPDLILLDLNMPKMDGIEFLQVLRQNESLKKSKVFVVTTSEDLDDRKQVKELGVSGYIVKPLRFNNPDTLDAFNLMIDLMNLQN